MHEGRIGFAQLLRFLPRHEFNFVLDDIKAKSSIVNRKSSIGWPMTIETEIKLRLEDLERFRRRLELVDAVLLAPRHFEENYVFDFPDRRLRARGCLLRVRVTATRSVLTYKGPAQPGGPFKSREELETTVANAAEMMTILKHLGLNVWFRYQKFREEYTLTVKEYPEPEVHVALDQTPLGFYAELEGSPQCIRALAARMGFKEGEFIRDSYYSLYLRSCERTWRRSRRYGFRVKATLFPISWRPGGIRRQARRIQFGEPRRTALKLGKA